MAETGKKHIYHGWWMVALLFYTLIHTGGNGFYAFPVYVPRLIEALGCSTTGLMLAAAIWAVVFGFANPLIGGLIQRHGVRVIFISGVALAGILMMLLSFVTKLWQVYAFSILSGFVGAATILVPSQTVVTNWFNRRRGLAMSLMMMGVGIGGFMVPQMAAWFIRNYGWRESLWIGAALNYLIVLPPLVLFLKNSPADVGQRIDGVSLDNPGRDAPEIRAGLSARQAVRTPTFRLIFFIFILQLFAMSGIQMNVQNFAENQMGYSLFPATRFMAFALLVTLPGRFIFGWLCDRINPKYLLSATGVFLAAGSFVLLFFVIHLEWVDDYRAIWLFAVFQGFGIAGSAIVLPILVGRCFGEREFSKIMGLVMSGFAMGVIFGPVSMGWIFDTTGNYAPAFILAAVICLLFSILALFVRPHLYEREFTISIPPAVPFQEERLMK